MFFLKIEYLIYFHTMHTGEEERSIIKSLLTNACANYPAWETTDKERRESIVRRIERNCFATAIHESKIDGVNRSFHDKKFVDRYSAICFKVLANIDAKSCVGSTYLIDELINGNIDECVVAELPSVALCPEASASEREEIRIRSEQKIVQKVSTAYVCYKCKENKTVFLEYQSRAADECSTKSIKCVNCGYVWRK
jgi:DNA-directed RNA polymerase subunit M/transcription elongation factor TFIIS